MSFMSASLLGINKRHLEPELMDDLTLDEELHLQALRGLERINTVSLTAETFWKPIKSFHLKNGRRPLRILDIASGAGDILTRLASKAHRENLPFVFEGCDFNPRAAEYANLRSKKQGLGVSYFVHDALKDPVPERFDIVINSLFLHHLSEGALEPFFKTLQASRASLLLICDLKRSLAGFLLAFVGTRLLSRSKIVHWDGPLSVRASFITAEILGVIHSAGLPAPRVQSVWPERYLLSWQRP